MFSSVKKYWSSLPAPMAALLGHAGSTLIGFLCAFVIFYVLYRIGLPSKPFIYVAF